MEEPARKRPKVGGQRQRLATLEASSKASTNEGSFLASHLERQWAWGFLSPQECQRIAALALEDWKACDAGEAPLALRKLAAIGSGGAFPNNCNRDMLHLVGGKSLLPAPIQENIPLKDGIYLQNILLPHETFHALWVHYRKYFFESFIPDGSSSLEDFWRNFSGHPCFQGDNDIKKNPSFPKKCIPVGMHGDAVPTVSVGKTWAKCQLCFSWHSLLRNSGKKATTFFIWSVPVWQKVACVTLPATVTVTMCYCYHVLLSPCVFASCGSKSFCLASARYLNP